MLKNPFKNLNFSFKFISNLNLSFKLIGGFGSVLFLFVLVMIIYNSAIKDTTASYDELLTVDMKIAEHAANIENLMLQCRKNEQGFLSKMDLTYYESLVKNVKHLNEEAVNLDALAKTSGDKKASAKVNEVVKNIISYKNNFELVVKAYQKKKKKKKSGLRGEFNKIVDLFTVDMSIHDIETINMAALKLNLAEKTYLFKQTENAKKVFLNEIDEMAKVGNLAAANEFKAMMNEMIRDMIKEYKKSALKVIKHIDTFISIDPDNEGVANMQENLAELMELVTGAYVQGALSFSLKIRVNEKNYLIYKDEKYAGATRAAIKDILAAFKASSVEKDYIDQAKRSLNRYLEVFNTLVATEKEIVKLLAAMNESVDTIGPIVEQLNINSSNNAKQKKENAAKRIAKNAKTALLIGLVAILFGIALSFIITRGITKPVFTAVAFARRMAEGDLSQQLEVTSKDEIGMLSVALNEMVKNLNAMFGDISKGIEELTSSSKFLSDVSTELLQGADTTKEKSGLVSDSSEKMNSNINSAASAIEEASASMNLLSETVENLNTTTSQIATQADNARQISDETVQQVESASAKIDELAVAATDIGAVTETIADISKQTNLLALNATIESARAGEAGKGFAVVAGEIKTLASQTEEATKAISGRIEGVQGLTKSTMEEINRIKEIMSKVNEIVINIASGVNDQSDTTHGISENISQASEGMQEITVVMADNSNVTNEIVSDITEVNTSALSIAESSHMVNESSDSMLKLGKSLENMIDKFTL